MIDSLYREEILEHYRNPSNFGKLANADSYSRQTNPLCGDDIEMWVKFNGYYRGVDIKTPRRCKIRRCKIEIEEVRFKGKGCAICIAAASMLTEYALRKRKRELTKFSEKDMLGLIEIELSETRRKCALLGWAVLQDCLNKLT